MKQILVAVALVMVGLMPGVSQAAPIFFDDFNTENGGVTALSYTGFANWTVNSGSVDLIGDGGPFALVPLVPSHGLYIDMDGTTNAAGTMQSAVLALGAGTYELTFDLAGSQRLLGDVLLPPNTLTYGIDLNGSNTLNGGDVLPIPIALTTFAPFTGQPPLFFTLSSPTSVSIIFSHNGGDNRGLLLDNVKLQAVPEPASLMLLGAGLAAIGIWRRKAAKG